ncbi:VOC family protein [Celerinatantimonas sp. MCCC 1A17872]|uniref:SMU1112c/YaeR family gloxylase I-like metalloprotein n=1 Tax=Celerinatantimonas sp. MCCC 1A17872 TaxID=3177514 RepID=UPI0038C8BA49
MFKAFHHVAIICSDYQRSKYFYHQLLGLEIIHEHYRHERDSYKLDLALPGGGQIELFSFPNPPARVSHPEASGLRHLAFSVHSLEPVIAHLEANNIAVEAVRIDPITNQRFTFFKDPDDLPLELYEA